MINQFLVDWLLFDEYQSNSDFTATSLLNPTRKNILIKRYELDKDISLNANPHARLNARLGQAVHESIQAFIKASVSTPDCVNPSPLLVRTKPNLKPVYIEQRAIKEVSGYTVSGAFDLVMDGAVHDIKTTSVYTYINKRKDDDYIFQLSVYRWLNPDIIISNYGYIHYIFKDWKASQTNMDNYPPENVISKQFKLYTPKEVEFLITDKLAMYDKYKDCEQEDMPECTPEELWMDKPKWKYYAKPESTRATKVFDDYQEALMFADGKSGILREYKGQPRACAYCPALTVCDQYKEMNHE